MMGLGSVLGAVIGGLFLGIVLSAVLKLGLRVILIVLVLAVHPRGCDIVSRDAEDADRSLFQFFAKLSPLQFPASLSNQRRGRRDYGAVRRTESAGCSRR